MIKESIFKKDKLRLSKFSGKSFDSYYIINNVDSYRYFINDVIFDFKFNTDIITALFSEIGRKIDTSLTAEEIIDDLNEPVIIFMLKKISKDDTDKMYKTIISVRINIPVSMNDRIKEKILKLAIDNVGFDGCSNEVIDKIRIRFPDLFKNKLNSIEEEFIKIRRFNIASGEYFKEFVKIMNSVEIDYENKKYTRSYLQKLFDEKSSNEIYKNILTSRLISNNMFYTFCKKSLNLFMLYKQSHMYAMVNYTPDNIKDFKLIIGSKSPDLYDYTYDSLECILSCFRDGYTKIENSQKSINEFIDRLKILIDVIKDSEFKDYVKPYNMLIEELTKLKKNDN